MHRRFLLTFTFSTLIFIGSTGSAFAQTPQAGASPAGRPVAPELFFKEEFQRIATDPDPDRVAVKPANLTNPDLELKVYGTDAKNLHMGDVTGPINIWNGMVTSPVAVTLRHKNSYVDLTGLAKISWLTYTSAFHVVRPVIKLADGTMLVGDHEDRSTTAFVESEFYFFGVRWVKLDPARIVTLGARGSLGAAAAFVANPDLSKVDEVGFVDLIPGSGHGPGGWINVGNIEVYGKPVKR